MWLSAQYSILKYGTASQEYHAIHMYTKPGDVMLVDETGLEKFCENMIVDRITDSAVIAVNLKEYHG